MAGGTWLGGRRHDAQRVRSARMDSDAKHFDQACGLDVGAAQQVVVAAALQVVVATTLLVVVTAALVRPRSPRTAEGRASRAATGVLRNSLWISFCAASFLAHEVFVLMPEWELLLTMCSKKTLNSDILIGTLHFFHWWVVIDSQ
ncbi:uncharacterized protein LOC119354920 [Triticum dicoccoides]|uniref:uncharacterized protein LOC119354920 n=1 Tax=Triticum dicoccoides TaxID=85692 RepID=UPI00189053F3|nr:uncharacterized protein LOC119354920 [Triticum dicoccoides]XP_044457263.1 uncharacterized protein LOC123189010 isoform X2 [Triticum aestivum]